jgi:hypothetical protein
MICGLLPVLLTLLLVYELCYCCSAFFISPWTWLVEDPLVSNFVNTCFLQLIILIPCFLLFDSFFLFLLLDCFYFSLFSFLTFNNCRFQNYFVTNQ